MTNSPSVNPPSSQLAPRRRRYPPGLLRRAKAAHFCGGANSTWDRLAAAGLTPTAIHLGGVGRWVAANCRVD